MYSEQSFMFCLVTVTIYIKIVTFFSVVLYLLVCGELI